MRAVLYLRVSTTEQVSNLSLTTQEQACREHCARLGLEVDRVFREEGESAKTADRTQLAALLAYLGSQRRKIGALVFYRIDRLARNRDDFYALRASLLRLGVKLHSASERIEEETVESLVVETFGVLQAQVDNMIRSGRTKTGMRAAVERGRWVWEAPIGYLMHEARLVHDPERAPLLRLAFERIAGGLHTVAEVRRELTARGLRTRAGNAISRETLDRVLGNPLYAGRIVAKRWGLYAEGVHEAIVPLATFQRAQKVLKRATGAPTRPYAKGATFGFPLRGSLRCECGSKMTAARATGSGGKRYPYYRCMACGHNAKDGLVHDAFTKLLAGMATPRWTWDLFAAIVRDRAVALGAARQDLAAAARARTGATKRKLERLNKVYIYDGGLDAETYLVEKQRLQAELLEAESEVTGENPNTQLELALATASSWLLSPIPAWDACSAEHRPTFVRGLFPEGLTWERSGRIGTPAKSLMYLPLEGVAGRQNPGGTPDSAELERWILGWNTVDQAVRAA